MIWSLVESPTYTQRERSSASSRPNSSRTIQRAPSHLLCAPNQPLMWMLLTDALMPAARIVATHASMAGWGKWVNSLWSMAMSVSRPAESWARRACGTSRSICSSTACMAVKLAARVAASCWYIFDSCRRLSDKRWRPISSEILCGSRRSATAPFSATIASTGQAAAKRSLQPTGRPVMGMTCKPAAFSAPSAASASAVTAPSVVRVSSMSVNTPMRSVGTCQGASACSERSISRRCPG